MSRAGFSDREIRLGVARVEYWRGHTKKVNCLAWNASGSTLASGSADASLRLWSVDATGAVRGSTQLRGAPAEPVDAVAWSPEDRGLLAAASAEGAIRFWDARSGRAEQTVALRSCDAALSMSWAPDGRTLAVGTRDDRLVLLDARRSAVDARTAAQTSFTVQQFEMNQIAWAPAGPAAGLLFISAGPKTEMDTYVGRIDVLQLAPGGGALAPVTQLQAHNAQVHSLAFDRSGALLASGSADSTVVLWSVEDMAPLRCFDRLEYAPKYLSFSSDGALLATASDDRIVDVVRSRAGVRRHTLARPQSQYTEPRPAAPLLERRALAPRRCEWRMAAACAPSSAVATSRTPSRGRRTPLCSRLRRRTRTPPKRTWAQCASSR